VKGSREKAGEGEGIAQILGRISDMTAKLQRRRMTRVSVKADVVALKKKK
jgi:hypothetical protein